MIYLHSLIENQCCVLIKNFLNSVSQIQSVEKKNDVCHTLKEFSFMTSTHFIFM